jgi:ferritin-like metal-binding protein YciE
MYKVSPSRPGWKALEPSAADREVEYWRILLEAGEAGLEDVFEEDRLDSVFGALSAEMDALVQGESGPTTAYLVVVREALVQELRNLRNCEVQWGRILPRMAGAAQEGRLKLIFEDLADQARERAQRVDEAAELMDFASKGRWCQAMETLVAGIKEVIVENRAGRERDGSLLSAAVKAGEYQKMGYGCARSLAESLGLRAVAKLLEASLREVEIAQGRLGELMKNSENHG